MKNELFFQSSHNYFSKVGSQSLEKTLQSEKSKPLKKNKGYISGLSAALDFVGYSLPLLCRVSCLLERGFANGRI